MTDAETLCSCSENNSRERKGLREQGLHSPRREGGRLSPPGSSWSRRRPWVCGFCLFWDSPTEVTCSVSLRRGLRADQKVCPQPAWCPAALCHVDKLRHGTPGSCGPGLQAVCWAWVSPRSCQSRSQSGSCGTLAVPPAHLYQAEGESWLSGACRCVSEATSVSVKVGDPVPAV